MTISHLKERTHLSASSMSTYNNCPMSFYLTYFCDMRGGDTMQSLRGNIYHTFMEIILKAQTQSISIDRTFTKVWAQYKKSHPELIGEVDRANIKEVCQVGLQSDIYEGKIIGIEKQFMLLIDKYNNVALLPSEGDIPETCEDVWIIKGFIDLMVKRDDHILIIDWKTGRQKSANALKDDLQYKTYSIVGSLLFPNHKNVDMCFAYVNEKRVSPKWLSPTQSDIQQHIKDIRENITKMDKDINFRKLSKRIWLCNGWCMFENHCHKVAAWKRKGLNSNEIKSRMVECLHEG